MGGQASRPRAGAGKNKWPWSKSKVSTGDTSKTSPLGGAGKNIAEIRNKMKILHLFKDLSQSQGQTLHQRIVDSAEYCQIPAL